MSTDFEKDLREQMLASGDHAGIDLDLDTILDDGHRELHRRTVRRAGVAGTLAALALVGGVAATRMGQRAAVPSAPVATPSSAQVVLKTDSGPGRGEPASFTVSMAPQTDGSARVTIQPRDGHGTALRTPVVSTLPAGQGSLLVRNGSLCSACYVAVVRGAASQVDTVGALSTNQTTSGSGTGTAPDGSFAAVAGIALDTAKDAADRAPVKAITGLLWRIGDTVHDSAGAVAASVPLDVGDRHYVIFRDAALDLFGVMGDGAATWWPTSVLHESPSTGYSAGSGGLTMSANPLPPGSTVEEVPGSTRSPTPNR